MYYFQHRFKCNEETVFFETWEYNVNVLRVYKMRSLLGKPIKSLNSNAKLVSVRAFVSTEKCFKSMMSSLLEKD